MPKNVIFTPAAFLRKQEVGAELFAFCHAEFISASLSGSPQARPATPCPTKWQAGVRAGPARQEFQNLYIYQS
jgi:hypothetical protein